MIRFEDVSVRFDGDGEPVLREVNLRIDEGELVLVVGATGSGKSTLLRCVNGLVPHFSGGTLSGRVTVDGRDTRTHRPRDLADVVGIVGQDPAAAFVTDTVEEELAYGMESLGVHGDVMRRRVEETLDLLGLADVRQRNLRTLSGGQQQRVAIGGVLAAHPRVLVLDEPTSALDPVAAEEVLAALTRLVHDLGLTVLLAEHRLERVVQYADRVVVVENGRVRSDLPAAAMAMSPVSPPIIDLGRLAGWSPLPLSVRDARRLAGPIRQALAGRSPARVVRPTATIRPTPTEHTPTEHTSAEQRLTKNSVIRHSVTSHLVTSGSVPGGSEPLLRARALVVNRARRAVLRGMDLEVRAGEIVALMGRNGSGKSTLLAAACGQLPARAGSVRTGGLDPAALKPRELLRHVGLVPQDPGLLLYGETVGAECRAADTDMRATPGTTRALLSHLAPGIQDSTHPRDLSEGQRLALALAIVLAGQPPLVLLDEPTRGLDYGAKTRLVASLCSLAAQGHGVLVATHDVELVAELADRVIVIADGEVVTDGLAAAVLAGSPAFAPQVAKVMHPQPWLTVADVAAALEAS